jgi:tripartite-type tricarboxylate transporter receptor subunit TctC
MPEGGITDFDVDAWYAILVPAKTPKPIIAKLNQPLNNVLADLAVGEKRLAQGASAECQCAK